MKTMVLERKVDDTEVYGARYIFKDESGIGYQFVNILDLAESVGFNPDWVRAWDVDGKSESSYEIVILPRSVVKIYGIDHDGRRFVSLEIKVIESGAFDDDFRHRVPDLDPFCMPAISTGDYDATEYETQFI